MCNRTNLTLDNAGSLWGNIHLHENWIQFLKEPMFTNLFKLQPLTNNDHITSQFQLSIITEDVICCKVPICKIFRVNQIYVKDLSALFSRNCFHLPKRFHYNKRTNQKLQTIIVLVIKIDNNKDFLKHLPILSLMFSQDLRTKSSYPILPLFLVKSGGFTSKYQLPRELYPFSFYIKSRILSIGWGIKIELLKFQLSSLQQFQENN